jgi:hypothetical protein
MLAEYLENNTYNNADTKFNINESLIMETEPYEISHSDKSHLDNVPLSEKNGGKQSKKPAKKPSEKQQKRASKKSRVEGAFDEYSSILSEIQSINAYIGGNIGAPVNFSDVDDDELYDNVDKSQSSSFSINNAII